MSMTYTFDCMSNMVNSLPFRKFYISAGFCYEEERNYLDRAKVKGNFVSH